MHFAEDLYKKYLTLDDAEEDQKEMLKKINELKKRINPRTGPKPKMPNKDKKWEMLLKIQKAFIILKTK